MVVHFLRAALFGAIVLLIHWQSRKLSHPVGEKSTAELTLAQVRTALPAAAGLAPPSSQPGQDILDDQGKLLGFALQTSPESDGIIGFSGPTNVLLVFDTQQRLLVAKILASEDTREHVEAVKADPRFFASFPGHSWEELAQGSVKVDAVSGATLTSLAIWESILHHLGGEKPGSLRFPEPLTPQEVKPLFPEAWTLGDHSETTGVRSVFSRNGKLLGFVLCTSPAADGLIGYQGPTESLIGFDDQRQCLGVMIRKSYDNQEYVNYVREDEYFPSLFQGMNLNQFAKMDLKALGVEGVSGATMTSLAVAEGLKQAAAEALRSKETKPAPKTSAFRLSFRDGGTLLVLTAGLLIGFTNLRGRKWVRVPFQIVLIGYLGFINGDLVSQALLVGWAKHGLPWQSATGLVCLSGAAVILPIFSKHNTYCHQLCPHGAVQQLLRNRLPWQLRLPKLLAKLLSVLPAILLGLVVAVPLMALPFSLVNLEPFDAYVFRLAGTATLAIFFVGLIASLFVPMAYCKFGCPTGALLNYLRFHGQSDRLGLQDAVAVGLLAMALLMFATT